MQFVFIAILFPFRKALDLTAVIYYSSTPCCRLSRYCFTCI